MDQHPPAPRGPTEAHLTCRNSFLWNKPNANSRAAVSNQQAVTTLGLRAESRMLTACFCQTNPNVKMGKLAFSANPATIPPCRTPALHVGSAGGFGMRNGELEDLVSGDRLIERPFSGEPR
jgi:hypothetical protein